MEKREGGARSRMWRRGKGELGVGSGEREGGARSRIWIRGKGGARSRI